MPARLSKEQLVQLPALLEQEAENFDFRGNIWTAQQITEVIWRTIGLRKNLTKESSLVVANMPLNRNTPLTSSCCIMYIYSYYSMIEHSQEHR
jgi:hypothetical protein